MKRQRNAIPDPRRYPFILTYDAEDGVYIARAIDLRGCHSSGATPEDALKNIYEAMTGWCETARKNGIPVPKPSKLEADKPKHFPLRLEPDNVSKLQTLSALKKKSLNSLINEAVAAMA